MESRTSFPIPWAVSAALFVFFGVLTALWHNDLLLFPGVDTVGTIVGWGLLVLTVVHTTQTVSVAGFRMEGIPYWCVVLGEYCFLVWLALRLLRGLEAAF